MDIGVPKMSLWILEAGAPRPAGKQTVQVLQIRWFTILGSLVRKGLQKEYAWNSEPLASQPNQLAESLRIKSLGSYLASNSLFSESALVFNNVFCQ